MKLLLCLLAATFLMAQADPVISTLEWRPACDGASIEVVSDRQTILSVDASAFHSDVIAGWSIHFVAGKPVSAEYREHTRGKFLKGERTGEYSGENPVQLVQTWTWDGEKFPIKDEVRAGELADILTRVRK
jgi:hypothetical protein